MKSEKEDFQILKAAILDWPGALAKPEIARAFIFPKRSFHSPECREIALALVLNEGDVIHAVNDLCWNKSPRPVWLQKFVKWADKIRGGAK